MRFVPLTAALLLLLACRHTQSAYGYSKDAETCPIHHTALVDARVPLFYGLPSDNDIRYSVTAQRLFPYGRTYALGGCNLGKEEWVVVKQCSVCVRVGAAWRKKYLVEAAR